MDGAALDRRTLSRAFFGLSSSNHIFIQQVQSFHLWHDRIVKNSFLSKIRTLLTDPDYEALDKVGIARAIQVSTSQRMRFRNALIELEDMGEITRDKKGRYRLSSRSQRKDARPMVGTIHFSRDRKRESAVFVPDEIATSSSPNGRDARFFVPGRYTGTALEGDHVEVRIVAQEVPRWSRGGKGRRPASNSYEKLNQAKVVRILKRNPPRIVGRLYRKGKRVTIVPDDGRLPTAFRLVGAPPEVKSGEVVVAKFVEWEHPDAAPVAAMIQVLGSVDDPKVGILAIIHRNGFPLSFPPQVLREANAINVEDISSVEDMDNREDWRERQVVTIDPADAKDFDDAVSVEKYPDGSWELAVHIADVSHYVRPGSALDKEAQKRGNSVYLADRVIPMLPEALSNEACSLKPGVDRLSFAAILRFDADGKALSSRFTPAVIRSSRRFSYEEVLALLRLDDDAVAKIHDPEERGITEHLKRAGRLSALLRKRRFEGGALDLEFPEVRAVLDAEGRAIGFQRNESDESHQLIEEFMLAANEAVARETKKAGVASLYRVHEEPEPDRLQEFIDLARTYGHRLESDASLEMINTLLRGLRGTPEEHSLKIGLLKTMPRAVYSAEPKGHYGLAKVDYTHFTSPIRRYSDLVVHRVLRHLLHTRTRGGKTRKSTAKDVSSPKSNTLVRPPSRGELDFLAEHLSRSERVAADAEMESQRLKLIEYLEQLCADDPSVSFSATVTGVKAGGVFIELDELLLKGMIPKNVFPPLSDYFYNSAKGGFQSRADYGALILGSRLRVRLYRVDKSRGFLDFTPVLEPPVTRKGKKSKGEGRRKAR